MSTASGRKTFFFLGASFLVLLISALSFERSTFVKTFQEKREDQHELGTSTIRPDGRSLTVRPSLKVGITVLTTNSESDMNDLCLALKSLLFPRNKEGVRIYTQAPVLIFNEGNLHPEQKERLARECTDRPLTFPEIDMKSFVPSDFDQVGEWKTFSERTRFRPGRERREFPWSYHAMIAFWTIHLWKHPATQEFDTLMRIDSDSCFIEQRGPNQNRGYFVLPTMEDRFVYHSNYHTGMKGYPMLDFITGLYDFAVRYMREEGIVPANPELWGDIERLWKGEMNLPVFQTNFEITRRQFFQRPDVVKWHEALSGSPTFGLWRMRWGDAQTRVFTIAMFAMKEEVLFSRANGYLHGRGRCALNFINEIYDRLIQEQ